MELLDGSTLADVCRAQGSLPLERALPLLDAMAAAVDAAHARGILHRDLKPGNVLLCPAPDGGTVVKVVDFGLAEIAGASFDEDLRAEGEGEAEGRLTATGSLLGTPLYVAPEVIRQQAASRASDLYSFGVIAYELLAGHPPFQGSTVEVLAGHLDAEPPVPALPEEVWEALREPLRKDPAGRPSSAGEMMRRIRRAAERTALARWRAAELPRRLAFSVCLTGSVLLTGLLLPLPIFPWLDHWVQDLRVLGAPARPPDPRIVLLSVGEASLEDGVPSLADRADEIGATLERVFAAGARGVAIDLVLPAKWSRSESFSNLVLRHPETLTLAAFSESDGRVGGTDCIAGLTTVALGRDADPEPLRIRQSGRGCGRGDAPGPAALPGPAWRAAPVLGGESRGDARPSATRRRQRLLDRCADRRAPLPADLPGATCRPSSTARRGSSRTASSWSASTS